MVSAFIVLTPAILLGSSIGAYAGAGLFMIGVLLFASQIGRVALGRQTTGGSA
jgi:hypothetical protein